MANNPTINLSVLVTRVQTCSGVPWKAKQRADTLSALPTGHSGSAGNRNVRRGYFARWELGGSLALS